MSSSCRHIEAGETFDLSKHRPAVWRGWAEAGKKAYDTDFFKSREESLRPLHHQFYGFKAVVPLKTEKSQAVRSRLTDRVWEQSEYRALRRAG